MSDVTREGKMENTSNSYCDKCQDKDACLKAGMCCASLAAPSVSGETSAPENHKLDTDSQVFFYEQEFYVLSNFSAFEIYWRGFKFHTSEAAYHFEKFPDNPQIQNAIINAGSAHEAYKVAERNKASRRQDWDKVKFGIMLDILRAKTEQHEYVRRKLMETGTRELVEDSWRDSFWGWGADRKGENWLGKLWMQIRAELHNKQTYVTPEAAPLSGEGGEPT